MVSDLFMFQQEGSFRAPSGISDFYQLV